METGVLSEYGEFFPTEPGLHKLTTKPDLDTGQQGECFVNVIKLELDVNHDGTIDRTFFGPDNTTASRPFRFWVNNDFDGFTVGPGVEEDQGFPDFQDGVIKTDRDLEDFARLWISGVPALNAAEGYTLTLGWREVDELGNPTTAAPVIKIYQAVEADGGAAYLSSTTVASQQRNFYFIGNTPAGPGAALHTVSLGSPYTFPTDYFADGARKHLLFEAAGPGKGELVLVISKQGQVVAQSSVHIKILDIKNMYERAAIVGIETPPSTFQPRNVIDSDPTQPKQLVVFVHGWRITNRDYEIFSESMFKRLWWQGYQGRFASLRWPTRSEETDWILQYFTFNRSEYIGFKSGAGASAYFNWLRARFPDSSINVAAHSQGGIVLLEALREQLTGGSQAIDNCVLMQAAVPAHCYDPRPELDFADFNIPSRPTPDTYRDYGNGINGALRPQGQIVNFFNGDDFALVSGRITILGALKRVSWEANQLGLKPDRGYTATSTQGFIYDPPIQPGDPPTLTPVTETHLLMARIARPRSKAVGARMGVGGVIQQNQEVNLALVPYLFTPAQSDHSGQFHRNIQTLGTFYRQLGVELRVLQPPTP